jgi:hypothetical protein
VHLDFFITISFSTPQFNSQRRMMLKKAVQPGHNALSLYLRGGGMITNCARPTRAFSSRALREQGDRPSHPASFFSILLNAIVVAISRTDKLFTLLLK